MTLLFAAVAAVVLWDDPVSAIRWEFDDGTTQGWSAKELMRGAHTHRLSALCLKAVRSP